MLGFTNIFALSSFSKASSIVQKFQVIRTFSYNTKYSKTTSNLLNTSKSLNKLVKNSESYRFVATNTHDNIASIQIKKRPIRRKKALDGDKQLLGQYSVVAFSTAEEYNIELLIDGLQKQGLYEPKKIQNNNDCIHATAKYQVGSEPRDIFIFKEGSMVLWNVTDLESSNVLNFLRHYEQDSYSHSLVQDESEFMKYQYVDEEETSCIDPNGIFLLPMKKDIALEKYTFSNAMILSVKLGIWEASLEKFIDTIESVTEDLKMGKKITMTREEVLRKHGELFALRHYLNLSSDVLDTPDFYWENEHLENLYNQVSSYFGINKRTKVMNEKINHCAALIELLSSHLSDKHHIRLEWMIIVLIMVEVAFETIHYIDRYMH